MRRRSTPGNVAPEPESAAFLRVRAGLADRPGAVVCKPDPRTAVCGGVVFARVFEEAGPPPGLFHMLPGGADVVVTESVDAGARAGPTRACSTGPGCCRTSR